MPKNKIDRIYANKVMVNNICLLVVRPFGVISCLVICNLWKKPVQYTTDVFYFGVHQKFIAIPEAMAMTASP